MDGLQQNSDTNRLEHSGEPASFAGGITWKPLPWLFAIYILMTLLAHATEDIFEASGLMPSDGRADPSMLAIALVALTTFALTILANSLGLTLIARHLFQSSTRLSILRTVELIVIETMRAMAATILRLPLLILPGLFEWIRLMPIPFLVLFSERYQAGEVDALKESRLYFRKHHTRVLLMLMLSLGLFLLEFAVTASGEHTEPLWQASTSQIGIMFFFAGVRLMCDVVILGVYHQTFRRASVSPTDSPGDESSEKKSNIL